MKIIPIQIPHRLASVPCFVDDEDYERVVQKKWYRGTGTRTWYAHTSRGLYLHRFIMCTPHGKATDHINGNGLDNRKVNLRICTQAQNIQHRVNLNGNNTSGHGGVSFHRKRGQWRARACRGFKEIHLGWFESKQKAIEARQEFNSKENYP